PGGVAALAATHEHVLAVDALEPSRECGQRAPRALVPRFGLELDAAAPERLEGVPEQKVLRLDVRASAPGGRIHPGGADLEPQVLRREAHVARRADGDAAGHDHEG